MTGKADYDSKAFPECIMWYNVDLKGFLFHILCIMGWLGHVIQIENSKLPRKFSLSESETGWKQPSCSQVMTWKCGMKRITRKLAQWVLVVHLVLNRGTQQTHGYQLSRKWITNGAYRALASTF